MTLRRKLGPQRVS